MRWTNWGFGLAFLSVAVLCVFAVQRMQESKSDLAEDTTQSILRSQNAALQTELQKILDRTERDARSLQQKIKKRKDLKSNGPVVDLSLAEPEGPRVALIGKRRIQSSEASADEFVEKAMLEHLTNATRLKMLQWNEKSLLLVKGELNGLPFVSAYEPATLLSSLRAGGTLAWLVLKDGVVAYHSLNRYIGSNAKNLRPVTFGIQNLSKGKNWQFSEKYLGFEGKEVFGVWNVQPELGALIGVEWNGAVKSEGSAHFLIWTAICLALIAGAFFGSFRRGSAQTAANREFDVSRLDPESITYLEELRGKTEEAIQYALEQEGVANESSRQRASIVKNLSLQEWKVQTLERFFDEILLHYSEKTVWGQLANLMAEKLPGALIVNYRFSNTSFSLVPESVSYGQCEIPANGKAFLADSRIFVGNLQVIPNLLQSEAFQRWKTQWQKHSPLSGSDFHALPYQNATGQRGVLLVLFVTRTKDELIPSVQFFKELVTKLSTFCDQQSPLIQSKHAKAQPKSLAGEANLSRN